LLVELARVCLQFWIRTWPGMFMRS
jgi:hypothetical protein